MMFLSTFFSVKMFDYTITYISANLCTYYEFIKRRRSTSWTRPRRALQQQVNKLQFKICDVLKKYLLDFIYNNF